MARENYSTESTCFDEAIKQYKIALKKYWLQCIFIEGSKILIFLIIFNFLGLTPQFITALFVLMLVRCNGGGIHLKHYLSCFLLSFVILACCIYLGVFIPISKMYTIIILLTCCILGYMLVPIVSDNRPEPDKNLIYQSKLKTVTTLIVYCFLICICPYNQYLNIGTWTIIIHIIQLILAKIIQRRHSYV